MFITKMFCLFIFSISPAISSEPDTLAIDTIMQNGITYLVIEHFNENGQLWKWEKEMIGEPLRIEKPDTILIDTIFDESTYTILKEYFDRVGLLMKAELYFANGQIAFQAFYSKGKENGTSRFWNEDGSKSSEFNYVDGIKNGMARSWYNTGELKSVCAYVNDEGTDTSYYINGIIESISKYGINGPLGLQQFFDEQGNLYMIKDFHDGTNDTVFVKEYYKNGTISQKGNTIMGLLPFGIWEEYHQNGQLKSMGNLKALTMYNENGEICVPEGKWQYWYPTNQLERNEFYNDEGKKYGEWEYFNESGELVKKEFYENNELIRTENY